jgi:hypothetical protein
LLFQILNVCRYASDAAIKEWTDTFKAEEPDPHTGQRHVTERMGQTLMAKAKEANRRPEYDDDEDEDDPGLYQYWKPDFLNKDGAVDLSLESLMWQGAGWGRAEKRIFLLTPIII